MGSWTANYQLYLAAAGEQGWADAINGNFDAIDTELKIHADAISDLDTRKPKLSEIQTDGYGAITGTKTFTATTATTQSCGYFRLASTEHSTGLNLNYASGTGSVIAQISAYSSAYRFHDGDRMKISRHEVSIVVKNGGNSCKQVLIPSYLGDDYGGGIDGFGAGYTGNVNVLSLIQSAGLPAGLYTLYISCTNLSGSPYVNYCNLTVGSGAPTTFVITNDFDILTTKLP